MVDLLQLALVNGLSDHGGAGGQPVRTDRAEGLQLIRTDVVQLVFGEPIEKHRPALHPIGHNHTVAAGSSLARPREPLLDKPASEIGVYNAALRPLLWPLAERRP